MPVRAHGEVECAGRCPFLKFQESVGLEIGSDGHLYIDSTGGGCQEVRMEGLGQSPGGDPQIGSGTGARQIQHRSGFCWKRKLGSQRHLFQGGAKDQNSCR